MGADCGTAILDGVGLGFANAVRRGPVGVVGASGTGIQEVTCLLDAAGVGVSHAAGVAFAGSLEAAAAWAAASQGAALPHAAAAAPAVTPGAIRGLFSGGTLCYEAMAVVAAVAGRIASNIPLRPEW